MTKMQAEVRTTTTQEELDWLSLRLSDLSIDERLACIVNSLVYSTNTRAGTVSALATIMITFSHLMGNDDLKRRTIKSLRDAANTFENALEELQNHTKH